MTWERSDLVTWLAHLLLRQLDPDRFRVFAEGRVRRLTATIFMPDVLVVPTEYGDEFRDRPGKLARIIHGGRGRRLSDPRAGDRGDWRRAAGGCPRAAARHDRQS
jgi:hypothetical protein